MYLVHLHLDYNSSIPCTEVETGVKFRDGHTDVLPLHCRLQVNGLKLIQIKLENVIDVGLYHESLGLLHLLPHDRRQ